MSRTEDSMADSIAGIGFVDERRDIDADFAHLYEIMESRSFRTNSGLAGEQPYYIYDYPPIQELEVAEHIKQLANRLQTMTRKMMAITLRKCLRWICTTLLWRFLRSVAFWIAYSKGRKNATKKVSSDVHTDNFLRLLDNILGADANHLPDTIRDHYEQAKSEGGADIVFITGIGKVYPYIRAHTLLNALQGRIDDRPLVLFYPGTFTKKRYFRIGHVAVQLFAGRQLLSCAKSA